MLNGRLALHDPACPKTTCRPGCIRDVEALCIRVLERGGIKRGDGDYDDRLAYLLGEAWIVASKYDPARDRARSKGREPNMGAYVSYILSRRLVDAERSRYRTKWVTRHGTYERERPVIVALDDELGSTLRTWSGDPAADRSAADLVRILGERNLLDARDLALLRERAPRRVA